jgi:hypothetical protein
MKEPINNKNMPRTIASKIFISIARENNEQVRVLEPLFNEMTSRIEQNPGDQEAISRWGELYNQLFKHSCEVIIFAAATAEAYIYDYGARGISDSFMKKYVDKLDLLPKWVVVPQLVKGRPFPREGQGIELLGKLVTARNRLIHFKSGMDKVKLDPEALAADAKEAIRALDALREDMERFDPDELPGLQLP